MKEHIPGMKAIRAAVAKDAKHDFSVEHVWLRDPEPFEVLVRIKSAGICHTDMVAKKNGLCRFPSILGHEGCGIVESIGEGVTYVKPGDAVIVTFDSCGSCSRCLKGSPAYCDDHGTLNFGEKRRNGLETHFLPTKLTSLEGAKELIPIHSSFFQQSSLANFAIANQSNIVKISNQLPLDLLAPLGCGVQTGAGAVLNSLKVKPGDSVIIYGAGCVGLSAVLAAVLAGASRITLMDLNERRLHLGRELGATEIFNVNDQGQQEDDQTHFVGIVRQSSYKGHGFDFAIDTTGNMKALLQAFDVVANGGTTAMIAPGLAGTTIPIPTMGLLPGKSIRGIIQGDSQPRTFIPLLIDLWQQKKFDFHKLITKFQTLSSINEAVTQMESGQVIKPVIVMED